MFYKKFQDEEIVSELLGKDPKTILKKFLRLIGDVAEKRIFSKNVVVGFRAKVTGVQKVEDRTSSLPGELAEVKIIDKQFNSDEITMELINNSGIELSVGDYVFVFALSSKNISSQNAFISALIK